jgi:hypothetical protein
LFAPAPRRGCHLLAAKGLQELSKKCLEFNNTTCGLESAANSSRFRKFMEKRKWNRDLNQQQKWNELTLFWGELLTKSPVCHPHLIKIWSLE